MIRSSGARSLLDLGCGDGELILRALTDRNLENIVGVDLCAQSLDRLRVQLSQTCDAQTSNVALLRQSITESVQGLSGFDCAVLVETIEHIELHQLSALEQAVFADMNPRVVIVTTPNAEFNTLLGVPSHRYRHPDHRFEWDRSTFRRWAAWVAARRSYAVTCSDIAGGHATCGGASQMAVFRDQTPELLAA